MLSPRDIIEPPNTTAAVLIMALIVVPLVFFSAIQCYVSYAFGYVVATLATVEDTTPGASLRFTAPAITADEIDAAQRPPSPPPAYSDEPAELPAKKAASVPLLDDAEIAAVPASLRIIVAEADPRPLTSSIRRTMKHLRHRGGRLAGLRGLGVGILWVFLSCVVTMGFSALFGTYPATSAIIFVATQMMLMRFNMLWTHTIISEPSQRPWYRRRADGITTRKIALPTLVWAVMQVLVPAVPAIVASYTSLPAAFDRAANEKQPDALMEARVVCDTVLVLASALFMTVAVWFPVTVAFVRCQAALLSDSETPIVPFDRTFGGLVDPYSNGRDGRLSMRNAWRSFGWAARRRLIGIYAKMFAVQIALSLTAIAYVAIAQVAVAGFLALEN